jgi:hypothetical protein
MSHSSLSRHPGEGRNPVSKKNHWILASASMTTKETPLLLRMTKNNTIKSLDIAF